MSYKPTQKVTAGALSGTVATLGIGVFAVMWPDLYQRFPPGFEAAIVAAASTFAAYMKTEKKPDNVL